MEKTEMSLKYASTRQVNYGSPGAADRVRSKLPADALPIATAPAASATPIQVYGVDGNAHWSLHHRGAWQKLAPFKDSQTGKVTWRMFGEEVRQPIAWLPRKK